IGRSRPSAAGISLETVKRLQAAPRESTSEMFVQRRPRLRMIQIWSACSGFEKSVRVLTRCLPGPVFKKLKFAETPDFSGAPDTIRTCDLCLRRATLYPAELRAREGHHLADWPDIGNGLPFAGRGLSGAAWAVNSLETAPKARPLVRRNSCVR